MRLFRWLAAFSLLWVLFLAGSADAQMPDPAPSLTIGTLPTEDVPAEVVRAARTAVSGPDRDGKDGPLSAVGAELALLYYQYQATGAQGVRAIRKKAPRRVAADQKGRPKPRTIVPSPISADGRTVAVDAVASESPGRLLADLRRLGLEEGATAGNVVSGRLPVSAIREAARLGSLRGMLPSRVRINAGRVGSEADTAHFATDARSTFGIEGEGQKICALSDSYDAASAATTASEDVESGDLPGEGNPEGNTAPVDVLADLGSGSDEGRAMLQLIHDIAPRAELGFHTAFGGIGVFASGIRGLADAGCTVIVDDVKYLAEPFYQDGPVANAADDVVKNDEVPYFSSAGNEGQSSYEAPFRTSGKSGVINTGSVAHDFDPDAQNTDTRQKITIEAGGSILIIFQWTDPSSLVEGSKGADTDLDLALLEDGTVVAQSQRDNIADGFAFELLEYTNEESTSTTVNLAIEKIDGPSPEEIKYIYSGQDFDIQEYDTLGPTVYGHAMAEGATAVAAAAFFNTAAYNPNVDSAAVLESFSSKGGIPILFDQQGNRRSSPGQRQKPEITGVDGVDNTFFGFDLSDDFFGGIDADPHPNFFGTSAAAPNVAAIAGLIQQARPSLTPREVYDRLESTAVDVTQRFDRNGDGVPTGIGIDPWGGHGFVRADRAVPAPAGVQIVNLAADATTSSNNEGTVQLDWEKIGRRRDEVAEFVVERQFFNGGFTEQDRVAAGGRTFGSTIRDLKVGNHTFRITALGDNGKELARKRTDPVKIEAQTVDVSVYPNPFDAVAKVEFVLPTAQDVRVTVYDVLGRRVATLFAGRRPADDSRPVRFDADRRLPLGSGTYFFRIQGEEFRRTVKAVRVR